VAGLPVEAVLELAGDGHEALDLLRRPDHPSLILLDLMLPVLDGWQFRQALKDDPRLAAIPVVVVSALDAPWMPRATSRSRSEPRNCSKWSAARPPDIPRVPVRVVSGS